MVGCIYRHPSANLQEFTSELKSIIKQLKNNKHEVFILGDMNVDFLKYSMHADTEEYLDMLYLNNFIPIITKPTRITEHSSTLIDHIYTNASTHIVSGIALVDISDHLPTFALYRVYKKKRNLRIS
jgi:endonuclease/exonuclease/phosphatase family metal-dependent hydrolase